MPAPPYAEQDSKELANEMVAEQPGKLVVDHRLWVVERGTELAPSLGDDVTQTAVGGAGRAPRRQTPNPGARCP
jgi:hypothetical protein